MEREEGSSNGFQMHQESRSGGMLISTNHLPGSIRTVRPVRDNDHYMPIANIIRIMRRILPNQAKISDDAKETIQECVSEYISFITGEANERCQREQRKTITADDILWAMNKLGFKDYVRPLSMFLHRYRELETDHTQLLVGPARGSSATNGVLSLFLKQQSSSGGEMDHLVHLGAAGGISNDTVSSSDYVPFHHQLMTTSQQLGIMGTYLVDGSVIVNQAPASQHHQQVAIASSDNVAYNDQYYKY